MTISTEKTAPDREDREPATGFTRRAVLKLGGATGLAMTTGGTALAARLRRPSHLRRSTYRGLVGQRFNAAGAGHLQLIAIHDLDRAQRGSEHAFELVFAQPRHATAPSSTPMFRHAMLGSFTLFLTPGRTTKSSRHYCAVINRSHT